MYTITTLKTGKKGVAPKPSCAATPLMQLGTCCNRSELSGAVGAQAAGETLPDSIHAGF